jgi:hypothetical protein
MTTFCGNWWQNCALEADVEILVIDAMEDQIVLNRYIPSGTLISVCGNKIPVGGKV